MLWTFQFLRMLLKGKLRAERYIGDLVFTGIVEALLKKLGFQKVSVSSFLCFTWSRVFKKKKHQANIEYMKYAGTVSPGGGFHS